MKYNNKSEKFKDWTSKKLIAENLSAFGSAYVSECYGINDMIILSGTERELVRRKYFWDDERREWSKG